MDNEIELNLQKIVDGHHKVTYRGIKMIKNPFDYLLYQMIINEVKPDLIIEVGTNHGGTALYMADVVSVNSYLIVEDGALIHIGLTKDYGGGPVRAIEEFMTQNDDYIIDRKWCDFFGTNATFNTNGFLKKIK